MRGRGDFPQEEETPFSIRNPDPNPPLPRAGYHSRYLSSVIGLLVFYVRKGVCAPSAILVRDESLCCDLVIGQWCSRTNFSTLITAP